MNKKCVRCAARFGTYCGYLERDFDMNIDSSDTPCESEPRNFYR